jgi:lipocalin
MLSTSILAFFFSTVSAACPPEGFSSINDFDLDAFITKRWYIQQQMETSYLPKTHNWCVYAEYRRLAKKSFWGYDVAVHNHAEEQDGTIHDSDTDIKGGGIYAKIVDAKKGKLTVAPYFLPTFLAGPYWVIDYSESEGYALVSGGAPTLDSKDGLCKTGSGTNNAGLWIFTRAQKTDAKLISKVRGIAFRKGFDVSVLDQVDQSKCATKPVKSQSADVVV